jgi:putative two-component system response regulator
VFNSGASTTTASLEICSSKTNQTAPRALIRRFASSPNSQSVAFLREALQHCGWEVEVADNDALVPRVAQTSYDVVILDTRALASTPTNIDPFALCRTLKSQIPTAHTPVVMILPHGAASQTVQSAQCGADNFFQDPLHIELLIARLDSLRVKSLETVDTIAQTVQALLSATEAKDFRIRRHSERVAGYANQVAEHLQLSDEDRSTLFYGSLLHDVGNIGIADSILLKPSGLSDWEFDEVRLHPIIGEQICKPLRSAQKLLPLIRSHHEKMNGSGYPDNLAGEQIPYLVRILSVIDVYDTLRSDRAYRGAFGHSDAVDILRQEVERGWWQQEVVALLDTLTAPDKDFVPV